MKHTRCIYILTLLLTLLLTLAAAPLFAQPVSTNTIEVEYQALSVATIQSYGLGIRVDGVLRAEPITCAAKVGVPADTVCRITIPALTPTSHSITVLASAGGVSSEYTVTGVDPSKAPKNPNGNPRIIITTTVTITS